MSLSGKGAAFFALALALAGSFVLAGCGEKYHNDAEKQFLAAARKGDAEAQYLLGASYERGGGAPRDIELAKRWYAKAAKQGHAKAAARLRVLNPPKPPSPDELKVILFDARKGDPEALCKCAECFEFGFYAEKDRDWALRLYAQALLRRCIVHFRWDMALFDRVKALAVELMPTEAEVKKFSSAARRGDAEAQYQFARCLEFGFVVKRNPAAAGEWYRRAAGQGHLKAQTRLKPWRLTVPRAKPKPPRKTVKPKKKKKSGKKR